MLDHSQIRAIVEEETAKARALALRPADIRQLDLSKCPPFPFLGDYVPEGWVKFEVNGDHKTYFVDSSGLGEPGEAALTVREFLEVLKQYKLSGDPFGFGIIEAGQFQVVVGVYKIDPRDFTHTGLLTSDDLNKVRRA
jgi:hypothetical protein